jgi:hypothetical protein
VEEHIRVIGDCLSLFKSGAPSRCMYSWIKSLTRRAVVAVYMLLQQLLYESGSLSRLYMHHACFNLMCVDVHLVDWGVE